MAMIDVTRTDTRSGRRGLHGATGTCWLILFVLAAPVQTMAGATVSAPACDSTYDHDIGVLNFRLWDTCHVEDTIWFRPVIKNLGRFWEWVSIGYGFYADDSILVYSSSTGFMLYPGDSVLLDPAVFHFHTFTHPGTYIVFSCTAPRDQNPANNGGKERVVVLPSQAVEESPMASPSPESDWAPRFRLMRAAQFKELIRDSRFRLEVFDPTGRRVQPTEINPGACFVRSAVSGQRSAVGGRGEVRKIVITR